MMENKLWFMSFMRTEKIKGLFPFLNDLLKLYIMVLNNTAKGKNTFLHKLHEIPLLVLLKIHLN